MFQSAVEAVRFAVDVQNRLKNEELTIRAGIHIGDVIFKEGDVFGSAVNLAARIEPLAPPNGICISEDVRRQIRNRDDIKVVLLGKRDLKGVNESVTIYKVLTEGTAEEEDREQVNFFTDLWNRRVFQITAIYLASAWLIKLIVGFFINKYMLSPHLITLTWVILLAMLPTVIILAYFHGTR